MKHLSWGGARWLMALALAGCSAQGGSGIQTSCSPGATVQCLCADGSTGAQTCGADMAYGACVCGASDGGSDVTAPTDLGGQPDIAAIDVRPIDVEQPPRDVPVSRDIPASFDTRPSDTGMMGGVCPATCGFNSDCDPCWGPGETRVGTYCCSSGLCIYSSDTCGSSLPDGSTMSPSDASLPDVGGFDLGPG